MTSFGIVVDPCGPSTTVHNARDSQINFKVKKSESESNSTARGPVSLNQQISIIE